MAYLNQVDAQLHKADHFFAHAELGAEDWPYCGHLILMLPWAATPCTLASGRRNGTTRAR